MSNEPYRSWLGAVRADLARACCDTIMEFLRLPEGSVEHRKRISDSSFRDVYVVHSSLDTPRYQDKEVAQAIIAGYIGATQATLPDERRVTDNFHKFTEWFPDIDPVLFSNFSVKRLDIVTNAKARPETLFRYDWK